MIKKSFRLMLLVAFALSSVMFVACNKYDEDIERIDNELAALNATVSSLKAAVDGGAVISSVSNTTDGVKFTLSNGQSYTVNHGTAGANGAAGKDGSVVTIGENGNWFIDGVDTGKTAKGQGEPGKSPRINEAGNWEVWNPETEAWDDTNVSAAGAQTYVVDCGSYYELNVMEQVDGQNAGFTAIKLPKTSPITSIEVVDPVGEDIVLHFGKPLADDIKFNGVTYDAGTNLIPAGSYLTALVNPVDSDASVYSFSLMDSHGNKPYVITGVSKNTSTYPMTKAANIGYWDMSVALADGLTYQDYATDSYSNTRSNRVYALTTNTSNGLVASKYSVTVKEKKVTKIEDITLNNLKKSVTSSIDLTYAFNSWNNSSNASGVVNKGAVVAVVDGEDVTDLDSYIIDCYFKIADATVAETYGLKLNGNVLTAEKPTPALDNNPVEIRAFYLLANGDEVDAAAPQYHSGTPFYVEFTHSTPGADALAVEWTVTNETTSRSVEQGVKTGYQYVFLPLSSIQNALKGAADTDLPTFTVGSWTPYGKSYHMDNYTYVVNDQVYGYGADNNLPTGGVLDDYIFAGNEDSWIATIDENSLYYKNSSGYYVKTTSTTKIQTALYVKFTFDFENAFPGEYQTKLTFKKGNNNTDNADLQVPVKVTIKSPAESDVNPFQRKDAYFSGDDAVAYGTADGSYAYYNMFDLFKDMDGEESNVYFIDEETNHTHSGSCGTWFDFATNNGDIKVKAYNEEYSATSSTNRESVYSTREITAMYKVYGNTHIPYIFDTFNLTIKSEIAEGTLVATSAAAASGNGVDPIMVSLKNITAKDVYGRAYKLAETFKYCDEHKAYDISNNDGKDSRISDVSIVLVDDNAKDYLKVSDFNGKMFTNANDGYSAFGVQRDFNKGQAALTKDVVCTIGVQVTDNWGRITTAEVKVTLKK